MVELIPEQTMKSIKQQILIKLKNFVSLTWFYFDPSTYRNLYLYSMLDLSRFFFSCLLSMLWLNEAKINAVEKPSSMFYEDSSKIVV